MDDSETDIDQYIPICMYQYIRFELLSMTKIFMIKMFHIITLFIIISSGTITLHSYFLPLRNYLQILEYFI